MKKLILGLLVIFSINLTAPLDLIGQDDIYTSLSKLFNEHDKSPTTISDRYAQSPKGTFSHSQIMNIPASSQADLLHKVLIIVDSTLYSGLTYEINRYAYDIHLVYGCNVIMEQVDSETCLDIKSLIVSYQSHLDGCVFMGDIAPAFYEADKDYAIPGNNSYVVWPSDMYYMDLTGTWADTDNNNIFNQYSGDKRPEIFVGRISTSNMGNLIGEIEGMRIYLNKNHRFWIGHRKVNKKFGLTYTNLPWQDYDGFLDAISDLYGNNCYDSCRPAYYNNFGKTDYLQKLNNDRYEFIQLASHSDFDHHEQFGLSNSWINGSEIFSNGIKTIGLNLFCCSACCWTNDTQPNQAFLGGDYVYSPYSDALCVVGCTKSGGMYQFEYFYPQLGHAKTIGQALVNWWRDKILDDPPQEISWNYGLTIIGDPLVNFFHCTNSTCQNLLTLTSYNTANSPLSYYLTSDKITVSPPSSGSFSIPVGDHCILNSPIVEIYGAFNCPQGATLEILSEGCQDNCDD